MARKPEKALSRRKFVIKLSEDPLVQWMEKCLNVATLPQSTRAIICELLKLEQNIEPHERLETKKEEKFVLFAHVNGAK
ncbi:hypothetical protein TNCT_49541 [Trichonephila clavata]|uniref:Uncharacterized protein n=1 Tax=Trichonephila clavata TaxID=2740835 RepID=A0A8X6H4C4_TRICU|nr:hypothetical protein TNCT_49541 [Trichonephila clavata]